MTQQSTKFEVGQRVKIVDVDYNVKKYFQIRKGDVGVIQHIGLSSFRVLFDDGFVFPFSEDEVTPL